MTQEERDAINGRTLRQYKELKKGLSDLRKQAYEYSQQLREVAEKLAEGRDEDSGLMLKMPTVDAVSNCHSQISATKKRISEYEELLAD